MTADAPATARAGDEHPGNDALASATGSEPAAGIPPALEVEALTLLCRAANLVRHQLDVHVLRDVHLTWASWDVLHLICGQPGVSTRQVAASAAVSKSLVTGICDNLVERGLIDRHREIGDQRFVRLYPTARGSRLVRDLLPQLIDAYDRYIATGRRKVDDTFRRLLRELFLPAATSDQHRRSDS